MSWQILKCLFLKIVRIWDKSLYLILFFALFYFLWLGIYSSLSWLYLFIFTFWYLISLCLLPCFYLWFLFDPLFEEVITNTSDFWVYMLRHVFIELVLLLSIFVAVMFTLFVDWSGYLFQVLTWKGVIVLRKLKSV